MSSIFVLDDHHTQAFSSTTSYASRRSHSGPQAFAIASRSVPTIDLPESVMKVLRNNSKYAGGIAQLQALSTPQIPLCTAAPTIKYKVTDGMKRKGVHAGPDCVECKLNHGSSGVRVHCGYSFVIDRSRRDWIEKTQDMVLEHLGFASLSLVYDTCKWEGCDDSRPHPCNKHGLGPHILDKHILKELEDSSAPPAPKRARHNWCSRASRIARTFRTHLSPHGTLTTTMPNCFSPRPPLSAACITSVPLLNCIRTL